METRVQALPKTGSATSIQTNHLASKLQTSTAKPTATTIIREEDEPPIKRTHIETSKKRTDNDLVS